MIERLEWDSNFFSYEVGACVINSKDDEENLYLLLSKGKVNFKLIYAFVPNFQLQRLSINNFQIKNIDKRITFEKYPNYEDSNTENVSIYSGSPNKDLYQLAYLSGNYSRFKIDTNFKNNEFLRLYKQWIDNSCGINPYNKIFVSKDNDRINGLVTINVKKDVGIIGLLSVNFKYHGQGIGISLLKYAENYSSINTLQNFRVSTQESNTGACNFYQSQNFKIVDRMNIYHIWNL